MILIATGALTILHPGRCFRGCWTIREVKQDEGLGYTTCDAATMSMLKLPTAMGKGCPPSLSQEANISPHHSVPKLSVDRDHRTFEMTEIIGQSYTHYMFDFSESRIPQRIIMNHGYAVTFLVDLDCDTWTR